MIRVLATVNNLRIENDRQPIKRKVIFTRLGDVRDTKQTNIKNTDTHTLTLLNGIFNQEERCTDIY